MRRWPWWWADSASVSRWLRSTPRCLASTDAAVHGLSAALVVVARMVGMLVGISVLTTIGLRRYYASYASADIPTVREVCGGSSRCSAYNDLLSTLGIAQEQAVFTGAAVSAIIAGLLALALFRGAPTRALSPATLLRAGG